MDKKTSFGWYRGNPSVRTHRKLIKTLYCILIVAFMLLSFSVVTKEENKPFLSLYIGLLNICNVALAAMKSNSLYKILINERAKLMGCKEQDFVSKYNVGEHASLVPSTIVYFINYTILTFSANMLATFFGKISDETCWILFAIAAFGIVVYVIGCFIGRNTLTFSDFDPDALLVEGAEFREYMHGRNVEIKSDKKELLLSDFGWLVFVGLFAILGTSCL